MERLIVGRDQLICGAKVRAGKRATHAASLPTGVIDLQKTIYSKLRKLPMSKFY